MRTIFRSMLVVGWLVGIPKNKFQPTRANLSFETLNIHGLHPWPRNVISSPERRTCRESRDSFGAARNSLSLSLPFQVYPLRWKKKVTFEHSLTEQRWAPTTLELGKRGVFLSFRYIYMWGELRAKFYAFCFLWKICTLRNIRLHVSNSHVSIEFFDVNFYFIRVIQLFVQLFVSDIIYLFIFFYITRRFKIHRTFWNLCSNFRAIKIYIFTIFMNIYLKKIALQYILIFTLNAITVR